MELLSKLPIILVLGMLVPVACRTQETDAEEKGGKSGVTLAVPDVRDSGSGDLLSFAWSAGDKLSMLAYKTPGTAGLLSSRNVVNFSSGRFSAESSGRVATFTGNIPPLGEVLPEGVHALFAIFPACNLSVSAQSFQTDGGPACYKISGPAIAERQDGSLWRHSWFTAVNGTISTPSGEVLTAPVLTLANAIVRLTYISGKDISKIEITQEEKSIPGLVGPFTLYTGSAGIAEGCDSYTLMIENSGKSLPAEVFFACRELHKGRTLSITFTASDGSVVTRSLRTTDECAPGSVHSLPVINLSEWTSTEYAGQAIKNMGMGVSVGGFESVTATTESIADRADADGMHILDRNDPVTYETNGSKDRITQKMMDALYAAGFHSIRLPVTWFNHMDPPYATSLIDRVWLEHLRSVIDLARNAGMYVVINIHHDAGTYDFCWLKADWANYGDIKPVLKNIWTQVAEHFRDYDYHLLFEGYNEICDENKRWWVPDSDDGFKAANALNQDFVDAVRATGGNNATRNLIVSTYTASEWSGALDGFAMPDDIVDGHLIVQVHSYRPNEFITAREVGDRSRLEFYEEDKAEIDEMFDRLQAKILNRGWPCVLGEYGAFGKKDANGKHNDPDRGAHGYYYTMKALRKGIAPIYWYNPMNYRDRDDGRWTNPVLADSLSKAWSDFQAGRRPEIN